MENLLRSVVETFILQDQRNFYHNTIKEIQKTLNLIHLL